MLSNINAPISFEPAFTNTNATPATTKAIIAHEPLSVFWSNSLILSFFIYI